MTLQTSGVVALNELLREVNLADIAPAAFDLVPEMMTVPENILGFPLEMLSGYLQPSLKIPVTETARLAKGFFQSVADRQVFLTTPL